MNDRSRLVSGRGQSSVWFPSMATMAAVLSEDNRDSRTNRILNSVKTYGNIVSFRDLEQATNDALALFGNKDAKGIVLLKPYGDYYVEYEKKVAELVALFPLGKALPGRRRRRRSSNCSVRSCG